MRAKFKILISGVAPSLFPTETFFGILQCDDKSSLEIPKMYPFRGEWGKPTNTYLCLQDYSQMPQKIDMVWLSICEQRFYSIEKDLFVQKLECIWEEQYQKYTTSPYEYIVVGMAPYGKVAIWFYGKEKSIVIGWFEGEKVEVSMRDFLPENPSMSLGEYCSFYLDYLNSALPPRDLFDNYMKQFTYRYQSLFEHWNEDKEEWRKYEGEEDMKMMPEFDYIEEALFDGTHDKLHDDGLMSYHQAGKPQKMAIQWHIKKSEYTAYFWFEDEVIRKVFDSFYGAHPDTKTDFMIRIDPEKNKYELALYRYGLKKPQVINESAYQMIVFKNKFECFRSENYNQPKGAWIW